MEDLASRIARRVQLTTDDHRAYLTAVGRGVQVERVDYAMLDKLYGHPDDSGRYSPPEVVSTEVTVMGRRDESHI